MASLEYAQARLSARNGARPDELAWRRIEHAREQAALLDVARHSAFRPWVGGVSAVSPPHEIEAALRRHWRDHVAEVARWVPESWRRVVAWSAVLPDLPVVAWLARGGGPLPWMREDPWFRDLVGARADPRTAAPDAGPFAPLAVAWGDPGCVGQAWRDEWHHRAPAAGDGDAALRDDLARTLAGHFAAFRDPAVHDGWPLRRALQARLTLLFRRAMLDPVAAIVYLALVALDLERLRGELLRRAAFPGLPLVA